MPFLGIGKSGGAIVTDDTNTPTPDPVAHWLISLGWTPVTTQTGLVTAYQFRRVIIDVVLAADYYGKRVEYPFGPPKF